MFKWKKWFLPLIDIVFQEIKIESCYIHVSKWEFKQNKTKQKRLKKKKTKQERARCEKKAWAAAKWFLLVFSQGSKHYGEVLEFVWPVIVRGNSK